MRGEQAELWWTVNKQRLGKTVFFWQKWWWGEVAISTSRGKDNPLQPTALLLHSHWLPSVILGGRGSACCGPECVKLSQVEYLGLCMPAWASVPAARQQDCETGLSSDEGFQNTSRVTKCRSWVTRDAQGTKASRCLSPRGAG